MPSTFTYTETYTRTKALLDQFEIFLSYAGVSRESRLKVLAALKKRQIEAVGVYHVDSEGARIEEIELKVSWERHSDHVRLTPQFSTELPGWEEGAAPEVLVVARRFGQAGEGKRANFWVLFTKAVRADAQLFKKVCDAVGVQYGVGPPEWRTSPDERVFVVQDMDEASVVGREAP